MLQCGMSDIIEGLQYVVTVATSLGMETAAAINHDSVFLGVH